MPERDFTFAISLDPEIYDAPAMTLTVRGWTERSAREIAIEDYATALAERTPGWDWMTEEDQRSTIDSYIDGVERFGDAIPVEPAAAAA